MFFNRETSYGTASFLAIAQQINFKHRYFLVKNAGERQSKTNNERILHLLST